MSFATPFWSEIVLQSLSVLLAGVIGYLIAKRQQVWGLQSGRKNTLTVLAEELDLVKDAIDLENAGREADKKRAASGLKINTWFALFSPYRVEYVDWALSQGNLDPRKDLELIRQLVSVKGLITNYNASVDVFNQASVTISGAPSRENAPPNLALLHDVLQNTQPDIEREFLKLRTMVKKKLNH